MRIPSFISPLKDSAVMRTIANPFFHVRGITDTLVAAIPTSKAFPVAAALAAGGLFIAGVSKTRESPWGAALSKIRSDPVYPPRKKLSCKWSQLFGGCCRVMFEGQVEPRFTRQRRRDPQANNKEDYYFGLHFCYVETAMFGSTFMWVALPTQQKDTLTPKGTLTWFGFL